MPDPGAVPEVLEYSSSVRGQPLPGGGIELVLRPTGRGGGIAGLAVLQMAMGTAVASAAWWGRGWAPAGIAALRPEVLVGMGAGCVGLGVLMLLVAGMVGPPREAVLEAYPGRFKADRWIAGDRVVNHYAPDDVECFFLEGPRLWVETRRGQTPLIGFGERAVNEAVAGEIACRLWHDDEVIAFTATVASIERKVFLPRARTERRERERGERKGSGASSNRCA